MTLLPLIVLFLAIVIYMFFQQAIFGKLPSGESKKRIAQSPNFRNGRFQNLSHTPDLAEGASMPAVIKDFFFNRDKRNQPTATIPSVKTDLLHLRPDQNILVWFGHSSYFMQIDGKTILVDPVFSGSISPIKVSGKSYNGSDVYSVDDFPTIDFLFISHDHYDHLDYDTIIKLKPKVKKVITGLGVAAHLHHWGYEPSMVVEKDWNEKVDLGGGFEVMVTPGRHFSGRLLKRMQSLWVSFVLQTPTKKIFLGGDSGYDSHFATIGEEHGPFDLAILECGQYNENWRYIHMMPEQTVLAAIDLQAKVLFPVHWAKFSLALHAWDDSIIRVQKAAQMKGMPLMHPMIGQMVNLDQHGDFTNWWEGLH